MTGRLVVQEWIVFLGAIALVCVIYPPMLGIVIGVGTMVGATYLVYKLIGG